MRHATMGAGAVLALVLLGAGAPQDLQKPSVCSTIDGAVRSISGYSTKDQSQVAPDGEFLRRVMLDLVGYPPNLDQVKAFMADENPGKRIAKIDELLESDDWADYWTRLYAEVFFGNYHDVSMNTMPNMGKSASKRIVGDFMKWFKLKLMKDKPWTEIVGDMIDARGTDEGDPALAWKLSFYSGEGFEIEFANGVGQQLLGIRLVCARCHDHPFDGWTVENYYGLASFITRQKARGYGKGGEMDTVDHIEIKYADDGELKMPTIEGSGKKNVDLASGGLARPIYLDGKAAGKNDDRMKALSAFMTSKSNTQLSRALANRVWGWLFGRGIVQPVDDFNRNNKALSPAVLDSLVRALQDNKYSVKYLIRAICNTEAYQRSCESEAPMPKVNFSRGTVKQLNGEQLINSIHVATQGRPFKNTGQVMDMVNSLYPSGAVWCEVTPLPGNARQALLVRNNGQVMGWISGPMLQKAQSAGASIEEKIDEMFLAALSRKASDSEKKRYAAFITKNASNGWQDAYWTLINTTEFVTRH